MNKTLKIGIVGFSRNAFDQKAARLILKEQFAFLKNKHADKSIEIVSGYTNMGVPKISYELADEFGFITVGFSANQALNVKTGVYPVQKVILHGERFGDESEKFIQYIDGLIRVGGGPQSRRETALFKERHKDKNLDRLVKEFEVDWFG